MNTSLLKQEPIRFGGVERLSTLVPGVYWRCIKKTVGKDSNMRTYDRKISAGLVLLVLDVEKVDGRMHTVVLKSHPSDSEDGCGGYCFLLEEFLEKFEFEPDGEAIRTRELQGLQAEIGGLQAEVVAVQVNPALMAEAIKPLLPKKMATGSRALSLAPGGAVQTSIGHALALGVTEADVDSMKEMAGEAAAEAGAQAEWITSKMDVISNKISRMMPFFQEKSAASLAKVQGILQYANDIAKGLETLDLYTGKGVEVETLVTGASAVGSEPLTLMQRKLFADEELAVWADVDEDFDFKSMDLFDAKLSSEPSLRDQLLPFPRCIVTVAIRRSNIDYGDPWINVAYNESNRRVFLLIRDGENVHRVTSPASSHQGAARLFPTRNELDDVFRGVDGEAINFEDVRFGRHEKGAQSKGLHYKRLLILLCGLDHRLKLFGDFYNSQTAPSFISMDFQSQYFRFISDDEGDLQLGEGRAPLAEWLARSNSYAQSGSRVLCNYPAIINPNSAPGCERHGRGDRPDVLASPLEDFGVSVAYRDGDDLCIDVRVKRSASWRDIKHPEFNAKVNVGMALARHQVSAICLDAVTAEEMEWYILDRESRMESISYIRLFKRTVKQLREERMAEEETRVYLREALEQGKVASGEEADVFVSETVRAWRCLNRGADLPAASDKASLTVLLDRVFSMKHSRDCLSRVEGYVVANGLTPLKVTVTGRNKLVLYVEVPEAERDSFFCKWGWVRRICLNVLKTKLSETASRLVWLQDKLDAKETTLKTWPELSGWYNTRVEPCQAEEIALQRGRIKEMWVDALAQFPSPGQGLPFFDLRMFELRKAMDSKRAQVSEASIAIPVGCYLAIPTDGRKKAQWRRVVICEKAVRWLLHFANPEQKKEIISEFVGCYEKPAYPQRIIDADFSPTVGVVSGDPGYLFAGAVWSSDLPQLPDDEKHSLDAHLAVVGAWPGDDRGRYSFTYSKVVLAELPSLDEYFFPGKKRK